MGVALSSGQSMLPAVLCGAVHRDAVMLVIDKPGEEKKTSCKVAPTSV